MYLLDLKQPSCKHSWAVPGCFAMLDFKFSLVALQRFSSRLPRPYQLIFFSSTIHGKFCGIHLLLFARPFVTAVLSLCSVVAVISKHSRTVFSKLVMPYSSAPHGCIWMANFLWFYFANFVSAALFRRHRYQRCCSFQVILFVFCCLVLFYFLHMFFLFSYSETLSTQWAHLNLIWSNLWFV